MGFECGSEHCLFVTGKIQFQIVQTSAVDIELGGCEKVFLHLITSFVTYLLKTN